MNKIILLLFSVLCLMGRAQGNSEWKMCVVSDVHLMAPELLKSDGKAFQDYLSSDRKLLGESVEIMDSITNRLLAEHPKVLLVTGDLTKDGERVSHQYLVDHFLSKLRRSGVRVFVIPGNHDVNNPHAVVFDGDKTRRTTTVSPSEFASIYADYGYRQALARDAASLSYVAQLAPGLRLIAIDACKYEENDFDKNICVTGGRIKPATQRFIREQADAAKKAGCKVVVMMHHGVVPHFSAQPVVLPEYLVDDYPAVGRMLRDCGADVVFSGHFHSQDIARDSTVTDVETGLAAQGEDLWQKSQKFARLSVAKMAEGYLPQNTPPAMRDAIVKVVSDAYLYHLAGDERPSEDFVKEKLRLAEQVSAVAPNMASMLDAIVTSLSTDLAPSDNQAVINY